MDTLIDYFQKTNEKVHMNFSNKHFHSGYEFIFITCGYAEIEIDGVLHKGNAPCVVILNPFEQHKILTTHTDYSRTVIVLNSDTLEKRISPQIISMLKCRPKDFTHVITLSENIFREVSFILENIQSEINNLGIFHTEYITNIIYNMLILLYRSQKVPSYNPKMMLIQKYFDENYNTISTINNVAKHFYISSEHLSRKFKCYSGYPPVEYLKNTRLYHAQKLLISTNLSVTYICSEVGFNDINNFNRQFKSKFGISPSKMRKDINTLK